MGETPARRTRDVSLLPGKAANREEALYFLGVSIMPLL